MARSARRPRSGPKPLGPADLERLEVEALELQGLVALAGQPYVARELGRARPIWRLLERIPLEQLDDPVVAEPVGGAIRALARFVGGEWPYDRLFELLARWPARFAKGFFDELARANDGRIVVRIASRALLAVRAAAKSDLAAATLLAALANGEADEAWAERVRATITKLGVPRFQEVASALLAANVRENVPWDLGERVIWTTGVFGSPEALRSLADAAEKDARSGSSHPRVAMAVVKALALAEERNALPLLERLAQRVRHRNVLRAVAKAKDALAARAGTSRTELEERTVPTFDLDARGRRELRAGLVVTIESGRARLAPEPRKGKEREARKLVRAIDEVLSIQRARLEQAMVDERTWSFATWRASFVEHPLLAQLGRGVVWQVDGRAFGYSTAGGLSGLDGATLEGESFRIAHPLHFSPEELSRARDRLRVLGRAQPWKQLFRETYVLAPRERRAKECLRFAGEVVPIVKLYALAKGRGWAGFVGQRAHEGTRLFAQVPGLRARLTVEESAVEDAVKLGALSFETKVGREVTELALADVPPVVFSEACRDLDLVVGIASIGEDATWVAWEDARRAGIFDEERLAVYERALARTADARAEVLASVLPALGLGARAKIVGRFVRVQGELHVYRVHLGSGNVHVDPSGRFIAWPEGGTKVDAPEVWLPEEATLDPRTVEIVRRIQVLANDALATDPELAAQLAEAS